MRRYKRLLTVALAGCMTLGFAGCGNQTPASTEQNTKEAVVQEEAQNHKIGVAVYSNNDDEVLMFQDYYKGYLEEAFSVEFLYSSPISDMDDEKAFVDSAKEEGCEGIISFVTSDLSEIVSYCGEDMYYVMGSGSVADEEFEEASQYPNFVGVMGPSLEDESNAGAGMIQSLAGENGSEKTYVLLAGGSSIGNNMHKTRLLAMLSTLETEYGFHYDNSIEEIALSTENLLAGTTNAGGKVYVVPGYLSLGTEKFDTLLTEVDPDVVASTNVISPVMEAIAEKESEINKDIMTGTIDCFSENNGLAFHSEDAIGNTSLNYIVGKCAAMSAPAFIAMYNAITGYEDIVKADGKAFSLHQNFWNAASQEEYDIQSDAAKNIFDNVYTTKDIIECMGEYNKEADFETFVNFVDKIN